MSPVTKEQKAALVDEIAERLSGSDAIFAVDYRGISVPEAKELRVKLSEADATFNVVKNRLAKRALEKAGTESLEDLFEGPTALAFVNGDPVVAAKAIATFAREHEILSYKGGIMDGEPLDPDGFTAIARLPAVEVLHGQLVGTIASPITSLARGLNSMLSGLAVALGQIAEQGLVGGEEEQPAKEEATEEAPPEEPAAEEEPEAAPEEPEEAQEASDVNPENQEESQSGDEDN